MLPFPRTTVGELREPGAAASRLDELRARPRRLGEASFFYFDAKFRSEAVKVLPGEYFVHDEDILITTTLGSCIAACLWDRQQRIGGMNHFMLPEGSGSGPHAGRYGAYAMELLVGELVKRGATRSTMEAKVFGGGALISGLNSINIGERNASFVLDYLRAERIAVVSKDVLDIHPRKVCFLPASGKAMVRRLVAARTTQLDTPAHAASCTSEPPVAGGSLEPT
jgi:chemotaxis protein CheD